MKTKIALLLLLTTIAISCDKDDFCTEATTPNLIITFYNKEKENTKKQANNLTIKIKNIAEYKAITTDSIAIPLDINNEKTTYIFTTNAISDTLQLSYTKKDIFVSRSCGYKTTFKNITKSYVTKKWIKKTTLKNTNITDEKTAHINIYH